MWTTPWLIGHFYPESNHAHHHVGVLCGTLASRVSLTLIKPYTCLSQTVHKSSFTLILTWY